MPNMQYFAPTVLSKKTFQKIKVWRKYWWETLAAKKVSAFQTRATERHGFPSFSWWEVFILYSVSFCYSQET